MEGTLREFPKFSPKNLYFRYPVHEEDKVGVLKDLQTDVELSSWQRGAKRGAATRQRSEKAKTADKNAELLNTFNACNVNGEVTVTEVAEYIGCTPETIRNRIKHSKELCIKDSKIYRK